jgi:hypothetical protein
VEQLIAIAGPPPRLTTGLLTPFQHWGDGATQEQFVRLGQMGRDMFVTPFVALRDAWRSGDDEALGAASYGAGVAAVGIMSFFLGEGAGLRLQAPKSGALAKVTAFDGGVVIIEGLIDGKTVSLMGEYSLQGGKLRLAGAHMFSEHGPGGLGLRNMRQFVLDFAKANGAEEVVIEPALRTTGPRRTRVEKPRAITVKVPGAASSE